MAAFFANQICDPFLPPESPCIIAPYMEYLIRAQDAPDIQKILSFTRAHNIRLVIRNTGHDYLGKSTGTGGVAIWMHHIKNVEVLKYNSPEYMGKAPKVGAGAQVFEALDAAQEHGLVVVAGNSQTVLEWETITADGEVVTATPHGEHADLYWALAGVGGGTYGVVISMTAKAYPEMRTATANLTFRSQSMAQELYCGAVETFIRQLGPLLDARGTVNLENWWLITNVLLPRLAKFSPGGGAYLNKANPYEPDWQYAFYGENYGRIFNIKAKYNSDGVFYVPTGVGSDSWVQRDDGRLY
ncbi:hypothetical protein BDV06DRAFT_227371 [Aspergillus oleicola]